MRRTLEILGLFLVLLFAIPSSANHTGGKFSRETKFDWRAKGKKPGKRYGLRMDVKLIVRHSWWDTGERVLAFTGKEDGGFGYIQFPGMIRNETGGIEVEFLFDPGRSSDLVGSRAFGAAELDAPFNPGTVPSYFYGAGVQYASPGNLNVFAYSKNGTGKSVPVTGNSVRLAVDVVDQAVSVSCLPEGATDWIHVDMFPLDSVPREFVPGAGVNNLPPKGFLALGTVITRNAFVGPAEEVLLADLQSVIDCEKHALAQLEAADLAEAKATLEGCVSSLEALIAKVEKAQTEGILPPDGVDPLVKLNPKTNGAKVVKKLRNALKTDQKKVLKKVAKAVDRGIPGIHQKVLKKLELAIQIKRLAGSWLKGLNLKKPSDLPPEDD